MKINQSVFIKSKYVLFSVLLLLIIPSVFFSEDVFNHTSNIDIGGKPVHLFSDFENNRLFVVDYENEVVKVVDTIEKKVIRKLDKSSYPVFCSISSNYIIVSDFWGYKLDFYNRYNLEFSHSVKTRRGPGFSVVQDDLLYFVTQREYYLQVLDIERRGIYQEFELTGRVPKFYMLDGLAILPYYDNYHTWSRDFELDNSIGIINVSSIFRWNIEGQVKKPLNIIRLEEGKYAISGYLDHGIHTISWGKMGIEVLTEWNGHSHIMDMVKFRDYLIVPSMSEEQLFLYDMERRGIVVKECAKGVLDVETYEDKYFVLCSNFDEKIQVFDENLNMIEEHQTGNYPIKCLIEEKKCYVLCMDSAEINVFEILDERN
jgi:hypothetical protein